jgi:hypothetical protein
VANGKQRKMRIFQLEDEGQIIRGGDQLKNYIIEYYRGMFGHLEDEQFSLDKSLASYLQQVSQEENEALIAPFTEKEVKEAIFQMKHNEASGPMVFKQSFTQSFGKSLKGI